MKPVETRVEARVEARVETRDVFLSRSWGGGRNDFARKVSRAKHHPPPPRRVAPVRPARGASFSAHPPRPRLEAPSPTLCAVAHRSARPWRRVPVRGAVSRSITTKHQRAAAYMSAHKPRLTLWLVRLIHHSKQLHRSTYHYCTSGGPQP